MSVPGLARTPQGVLAHCVHRGGCLSVSCHSGDEVLQRHVLVQQDEVKYAVLDDV